MTFSRHRSGGNVPIAPQESDAKDRSRPLFWRKRANYQQEIGENDWFEAHLRRESGNDQHESDEHDDIEALFLFLGGGKVQILRS